MFLIVMFKHLAFGSLQTTKEFNKPVICIEKATSKSWEIFQMLKKLTQEGYNSFHERWVSLGSVSAESMNATPSYNSDGCP